MRLHFQCESIENLVTPYHKNLNCVIGISSLSHRRICSGMLQLVNHNYKKTYDNSLHYYTRVISISHFLYQFVGMEMAYHEKFAPLNQPKKDNCSYYRFN